MRESVSLRVRRKLGMTASTLALWGLDKLAYRFDVKSCTNLTLPDFLGLGAQKAGSSWLWANLRCHPDLFLPDRKELHYFNLYFYTRLSGYAANFTAGTGKIKGEITPAYGILSPRKIQFVKHIMPEVKLVLILRNPIDRAWSRAKMVLREPGDNYIDVSAFSKRELHRALAHPSSLARGDYLTIIDNWLRHFPEHQLHIGYYEDLAQHPREFLEGVFEFLGVRTDVDWSGFPFQINPNPTPNTEIPPEYKNLLETLYCPQIEALFQRFGSKVESWRCT